jgi:hypothetical protein
MTRWRVTKKAGSGNKRIATEKYWMKRHEAEEFCRVTNGYFPGSNARVVRDCERVRKMIP